MLQSRAFTRRPWHTAGYATTSKPTPNTSPPTATWKAVPPESRISRHPEYPEEPKKPIPTLRERLWPTKPREPVHIASQDPARGAEAARRVVKEGVLDPRYKPAARRYTAIIVCIPIIVATSYELWQRRFAGKERKRTQKLPAEEEGAT